TPPCIPVLNPLSTCYGPAWRRAPASPSQRQDRSLFKEISPMNRKILLILLGAAAAVAATAVYAGWFHRDTALYGSGTIEARAAAGQAKADYELRKNGYRKEEINVAQDDLERAKADEIRTRLDFDRYNGLAKKDLVSRQQRDTAEANWKMALAQREMAQHK